MALRIGEILNNRYRILKQLGEGGYGAVYRADDTVLRTVVAVKENLDYWDVAQRQFEREAVLLANLRHPNLPRVTDFFTLPAQGQYLIMDFVEGYDLKTVLDRVGKPLDAKRVLRWIDQICDALAYLHSQKPAIIHRDVKPANIRITASAQAILVDFGIAKAFDPDIKTTTGARAITPGYSPVEQYGEETTDERADQYAIGATLYALLTGKRPVESISRVTGKILIKPRQLNPKLSPAIEGVILRAMQIHPEDRFPNILIFRAALRQAAREAEQLNNHQNLSSPITTTSDEGELSSTSEKASHPAREGVRSYRLAQNRHVEHKTRVPTPMDAQQEWITISAGNFMFGEEPRVVYLPEYRIARYPVTNQQYQTFLSANPHYPPPPPWKGREAPLGKLQHPVVGVSLKDAVAFCEWLGCRLPSAEEWEKAARGEEGRTYPWGEVWEVGTFCNNWENRIGGTTPVNQFENGVSPYGVWDMVGNVWEWTSSEYQGPFIHVLKGGSWRAFGKFAVRATHIDSLTIDDRRDDLGFRCAHSV